MIEKLGVQLEWFTRCVLTYLEIKNAYIDIFEIWSPDKI